MEKTVCELFAGVGGFRLGLERESKDWKPFGSRNGNQIKKSNGPMPAM